MKKDIIEQNIQVGNIVCYVGTLQNKLTKGVVIELTDKMVKIKTPLGDATKRQPNQVIVIDDLL